MKRKFLQWLSKWLPFRIPLGKSMTVTDTPEPPPTEITLVKIPNFSPFFKVKQDSLIFEYVGSEQSGGKHVLENVGTQERITVSTETLVVLFKGVTVKVNFKM